MDSTAAAPGPLDRYRTELRRTGFSDDPAQAAVAELLDDLRDRLVAADPTKGRGLLSLLRRADFEPETGLYIWGGEPTVELPESPGRGGRCQAAALAAAQVLQGCADVALLCAGTDGSDGPNQDAGALVDGGTIQRGSEQRMDATDSLLRADAGTFLEVSGDLIETGPTGTNVTDLFIGYRSA